MSPSIVNLVYLIAGILFILGIKGLTKPATAVRGNMLSATGMLIAVVITLLNSEVVNFTYIILVCYLVVQSVHLWHCAYR